MLYVDVQQRNVSYRYWPHLRLRLLWPGVVARFSFYLPFNGLWLAPCRVSVAKCFPSQPFPPNPIRKSSGWSILAVSIMDGERFATCIRILESFLRIELSYFQHFIFVPRSSELQNLCVPLWYYHSLRTKVQKIAHNRLLGHRCMFQKILPECCNRKWLTGGWESNPHQISNLWGRGQRPRRQRRK